MKTIECLVVLFIAIEPAPGADFRTKANSHFDWTINSQSRLGDYILPVRYFEATKEGDAWTYGLFVIFDHEKGQFQWLLRPAQDNKPEGLIQAAFASRQCAIYTEAVIMVVFGISPRSIAVLDAHGEARDVDEAQERALMAAGMAPKSEAFSLSPRWRSISLLSLPDGFWSAPAQSQYGPLKILSVARDNDGWILTIAGQWREIITLDRNYKIVEMKKDELFSPAKR